MEKRKISGPFGIVLTPYMPDGRVDFERLQRQVDTACRAPISGVVACGSTGEFSCLSFEENIAILEAVKQAVPEGKMLIGGATAGDTRTSISYLEACARVGAIGALTAPCFYLPMSDQDVISFYRSLSQADTGVPVIAYNIPAFTSGVSLVAYEEIISLPNLCGLKNSSGNINEIMQEIDIRDCLRPDFSVLTGSDEGILAETAVGCDGSFTACGYLMPEWVTAIYYGTKEQARRAQSGLLRLIRLANRFTFPYGYKLIGMARGMDFGAFRQIVTEGMRRETPAVLEQMKEIIAAF